MYLHIVQRYSRREWRSAVVTWCTPSQLGDRLDGLVPIGAWAFECPSVAFGVFYFRLLGLEVSVW